MENALALFAAAVPLMGGPGPVTLSSAASGAAYRGRAFPFVLGMTLGTGTVIVLVATGVTGLIAAIPGLAPLITLLAGAYILFLSWKIATAPPVGILDDTNRPPPLLAGYALAVVNPKAYTVMAALFSGFVLVPGDPIANGALKAGLLIPFALVANTTWMIAGASLARALRDARTSRILNVVFAVLLVVSVAVAVAV